MNSKLIRTTTATVASALLVALGLLGLSPAAMAQTVDCSSTSANTSECRLDAHLQSGDAGNGGDGAESGDTGTVEDSSNGLAGDGGSGGPGGDGGGTAGSGGGGGASTIANSGDNNNSEPPKPAVQSSSIPTTSQPGVRNTTSGSRDSGTSIGGGSGSGSAALSSSSSAGGGGGETQGDLFNLETVQTSSKSFSRPALPNPARSSKREGSSLQDWQIVGVLVGLLTLSLWRRPLKHHLQPLVSDASVNRRSR